MLCHEVPDCEMSLSGTDAKSASVKETVAVCPHPIRGGQTCRTARRERRVTNQRLILLRARLAEGTVGTSS